MVHSIICTERIDVAVRVSEIMFEALDFLNGIEDCSFVILVHTNIFTKIFINILTTFISDQIMWVI